MPTMPSDEALLALKGTKIPVPDLLALFGTRRRDDQAVLAIAQALTNAGLSTVPSFATCGRQIAVHVVALETVTAPDDPGPDEESEEEPASGLLPQHPLRIGDIAAARAGLESLPSSAQLSEATYLMRTKDYSQLPIIDGATKLCGAVTWNSVARMYEKVNVDRVLANAMVDDPPVVEEHQNFFAALPLVSEKGYVLVRRNDGRFSGIVTSADITERFDATARPFFIVGEIEFLLRKCLGAAIDPEAIKAVQPKKPERQTGKISDLMFGDYVTLLDGQQTKEALRTRADQNWQALGWPMVNRIQFVYQLDQVRKIRNKIAHFAPEPMDQQSLEELGQFLRILRQLV
ncbi:CBS domain-containing protein [Streptomyces sp. NBC_00268]|uniref:CBS domain-containing protein n=1 Tax=Streptomyces sp. NBC_00268 TaxID=2975695 RepID=UPI00225051FA|nr:CBS domain-containing protein [Streptomyces sp. NBC_00268]MCX5184248.1 CBS domain-containing protein [Streptomyces sp. NBC_00268]